MKDESLINIESESGSRKQFEVMYTFKNKETEKTYIVYTDHTRDRDGLERVYANILDDDNKSLYPVETDEEWQLIEEILSSIDNKG